MPLKIHNLRVGFATNSSSTHSMIFSPGGTDSDVEGAEFGWQEFVAASSEAKARWLACHLMASASNTCGTEVARALCQLWLGVDAEGYVDHQSLISLPRDWEGKGVDKGFFDELREFVMQENLVVLGGNDNEATQHGPIDYRSALPVDDSASYVARKDSRGWWVLFDRGSGVKIRMSFTKDDITAVSADKSDTPELIDVKITDYCPFGCEFCLEPSTLVLTKDLRWVPIRDLREGDELVGFDESPPDGNKQRKTRVTQVERVWSTQREAVRITTDQGEIIASLDHRFLMADSGGRWRSAGRLRLGQSIVFGAQPWGSSDETEDYLHGYLRGMSDGDGTCKWESTPEQRQVWWRVALTDSEALERIQRYLDVLGVSNPGIRPFFKGTKKHRPLNKVETRAQASVDKLRQILLDPGDRESYDYKRGYLSGFYDAEGTLSGGNSVRFCQTQTNGHLDRVERYLCDFGFNYEREWNATRVLGTMWDCMRLFGLIQPAITRKTLGRWVDVSGNHTKATIVKMELLGSRELIDIQTSTRTFYAQGFATHNCYQDSTPQGKHADANLFWGIARAFAKMRVFEVAIGGGEPTLHPDFVQILGSFAREGVRPSFTTRNVAWVKDPRLLNAIMPLIGSWAYSTEDADELKDVIALLRIHGVKKMPDVQYIVGVGSTGDMMQVAETCAQYGLRLTLLGSKTTGRGKSFMWGQPMNWLRAVVDMINSRRLRLGIDTALAQQYDEELKQLQVPPWCYYKTEGKFSMYYDAVTQQIAPSSYGPSTERIPLSATSNLDQVIPSWYAHW